MIGRCGRPSARSGSRHGERDPGGRRRTKGGCRSRRRSGPASHGLPATSGGGVPGARRAALQPLRPPRRRRCRWPARAGHLDQRSRPGRADPPGPGRRTLRRRRGIARSGPGSVASTACTSAANGCDACSGGRLLAPQPLPWPPPAPPHDGTIIPQAPNQRWGTDATMAWTRADGLGVGVCLRGPLPRRGLGPCGKVGDRFAALQPVSDAVIDRWAAWRLTSPAAWRRGTTGDPSTARPTSPAPWPGWHQRRPGVPG
jgi:hypothetical protein